MTNEVSADIVAAVKRCKLPVRVESTASDWLFGEGFTIWETDGGLHDPICVDTPRQAMDAYLALCRTLEGQ